MLEQRKIWDTGKEIVEYEDIRNAAAWWCGVTQRLDARGNNHSMWLKVFNLQVSKPKHA